MRKSNQQFVRWRCGADLDVSWLVPADLGAVDTVARLHLALSRCGGRLVLHRADRGLVELLDFVGLGDVLHMCPCCRGAGCAGLGPGAEGNPERLEQRRLDEGVDGPDAPADDVEDVDGESDGRAARRLGPIDGGGR